MVWCLIGKSLDGLQAESDPTLLCAYIAVRVSWGLSIWLNGIVFDCAVHLLRGLHECEDSVRAEMVMCRENVRLSASGCYACCARTQEACCQPPLAPLAAAHSRLHTHMLKSTRAASLACSERRLRRARRAAGAAQQPPGGRVCGAARAVWRGGQR